MKINDQVFSAEVELPCRLFHESGPEISGIVTSIDTGSLVLELPAVPKDLGIEDRVRLEMALPVGPGQVGSKYLNVRGRLVNVEMSRRGSWQLRFKLWKTRFSDRTVTKPPKSATARAHTSGERM
jgi:hypothetical protein